MHVLVDLGDSVNLTFTFKGNELLLKSFEP